MSAKKKKPGKRMPAKKKAGKGHEGRFSREFKNWLRSFREIKTARALVVASFDVMLYVLFFAFSFIAAYVIKNIAEKLQALSPALTASLSTSVVAGQASDMQSMLARMLVYVILIYLLYLVLLLLSFVLSRYLIWATLLEKKLKHRTFWKFTLLNIVWFIMIGAAVLLLSLPAGVMANPMAIIIYAVIAYGLFAIAGFYFTYLLYYVFMEKNLVFSSIKNAFVLGIKKFRYLWLPALLIIMTFIIVLAASMILNLMPDIIRDLLGGLLLLAVLTWMKLYAVSVLKRYVKLG